VRLAPFHYRSGIVIIFSQHTEHHQNRTALSALSAPHPTPNHTEPNRPFRTHCPSPYSQPYRTESPFPHSVPLTLLPTIPNRTALSALGAPHPTPNHTESNRPFRTTCRTYSQPYRTEPPFPHSVPLTLLPTIPNRTALSAFALFLRPFHHRLLFCLFHTLSLTCPACLLDTRPSRLPVCLLPLLGPAPFPCWFPRRFPFSCMPADFRYLLAQRPSKPGRSFLFFCSLSSFRRFPYSGRDREGVHPNPSLALNPCHTPQPLSNPIPTSTSTPRLTQTEKDVPALPATRAHRHASTHRLSAATC
jgi:hypothetical protein